MADYTPIKPKHKCLNELSRYPENHRDMLATCSCGKRWVVRPVPRDGNGCVRKWQWAPAVWFTREVREARRKR